MKVHINWYNREGFSSPIVPTNMRRLDVRPMLVFVLISFSGSIQSTGSSKGYISVTQVSNNPEVNYTSPSEYDSSSKPPEEFNKSTFREIPGLKGLLRRFSSNQLVYHKAIPANQSQLNQLSQAYNKTPSGLFKYKNEVYEVNRER